MANDTYTPEPTEYDDEVNYREEQAVIDGLDRSKWMISYPVAKKMADESYAIGVAVGRAEKVADLIDRDIF